MQPAPLHIVEEVCRDAAAWLMMPNVDSMNDGKPQQSFNVGKKITTAGNVVVIHCKAGKGRTGIMVTCLMLHLVRAIRCERTSC